MDSRFCTYKRVGYLKSNIVSMIGIDFTGIIYASPGVLKHISKRHSKQFNTKSSDTIIRWMRKIINKPDYVGAYINKEGQIAVQIIKRMYTNMLLGIEIDREKKYIYVATMYPITDKKINNKLKSGKLIDLREEVEMVESCII